MGLTSSKRRELDVGRIVVKEDEMFLSEQEIERQQRQLHIAKLTAAATAARYRAEQLKGVADRDVDKDRAAEYRDRAKASRDEHDRLTDEAAKAAKAV